MATLKNLEQLKQRISKVISNSKDDRQLGAYHQSLEDLVYDSIRDKLMYHELKPNDRIIDAKLAEELGVSRSLVRQALNILEREELVISIPRRGYYVKEITKKDVEEIYNIRKLLEMYAVELAVPVIPQEQVERVGKIFQEAKEDLKKGLVEATIEADMRLHGMITDYCGNGRLKKMIQKYNNLYIFYRIVDLSRIERANEAYEEHLEILEAVKKQDVDEAKRLMEEHIENAREIILENFDRYTYSINIEA